MKLIDVIGRTGRNWPIRDGKDQIKLISSSVKGADTHTSFGGRDPSEAVLSSRNNGTNATRDPHASLSLFAPRESEVPQSSSAVVPPRASAKPAPRDYHDLFVGPASAESTPNPESQNNNSGRSASPDKVLAKGGAGAGRNYQPSRIFGNDEDSPLRPAADRGQSENFYRPNPTKYQHFDIASGTAPQESERPAPVPNQTTKTKGGSQWNFDDFNTPEKVVPGKVQKGADVRHWGNSDDEVVDSPIKRERVDKPRRDADTHFEFEDDGTPAGAPRLIGRPRGPGQDNGLSLYKDNMFDDGDSPAKAANSRALGNVTNVKDRRKDFDPHFTITDDSPATKSSGLAKTNTKGGVNMMDAGWTSRDESPSRESVKENAVPGSNPSSRPGTGKGPLSESSNTMSARNDAKKGIMIGGDGMGGKKGAGRTWGFGDDSDGEETGGLNGSGGQFRRGMPAKKQGTSDQTEGGGFWDY